MKDTARDIYGGGLVLEGTEWDDVWVECASDEKTKRILMIGDSITRGFRAKLKENIFPDALPNTVATSKSVDNPAFCALIDYHLASGYEYSAVHFMSGPHGLHMSTETFKDGFERLVLMLKERLPLAKIAVGTYPRVRLESDLTKLDAEKTRITEERNAAVCEIAQKYGLPVNDLYRAVGDNPEIYSPDGLHLSAEGYALLAETTARFFKTNGII